MRKFGAMPHAAAKKTRRHLRQRESEARSIATG
jgi:hypothetical protein